MEKFAIWLTPAESATVQELLFFIGYKWSDGSTDYYRLSHDKSLCVDTVEKLLTFTSDRMVEVSKVPPPPRINLNEFNRWYVTQDDPSKPTLFGERVTCVPHGDDICLQCLRTGRRVTKQELVKCLGEIIQAEQAHKQYRQILYSDKSTKLMSD